MGSQKLKTYFLAFIVIQAFAASASACDFCSTKNLPKSNAPAAAPSAPAAQTFQPPSFTVRGAAAPSASLGKLDNGYLDSIGKDYPVDVPQTGRRTGGESEITVTDPSEVFNASGN